jgi:hypothetical protein
MDRMDRKSGVGLDNYMIPPTSAKKPWREQNGVGILADLAKK